MYRISGSCSDITIPANELQDALSLARARVTYYRGIGWNKAPFEDMLSAAYQGISEARIRFQPETGSVKDTKFTSYAYPWINKYIREFITKTKTMISGGMSALYTNQVGYAVSIDSYDDNGHDSSGSDHKMWLSDQSETAFEKLQNTERNTEMLDLIDVLCKDLDDSERSVLLLSFGIGTISNEQYDNRRIAKMLDLSINDVDHFKHSALCKLQSCQAKYKNAFISIYSH
jgi:RNA polymerase sigma factor (sigma-70 family)